MLSLSTVNIFYFKINRTTSGYNGLTISLFSLGYINTSISSIGIDPRSISVSPGNTMALQVAVRFSNCTSTGPTISNSIGLPSASCAIRFFLVYHHRGGNMAYLSFFDCLVFKSHYVAPIN